LTLVGRFSTFCRRAEQKGVMRDIQGVEVQVQQKEIEAGMRAHPNLPNVLADWLQKEAVQGNAVVLDE